MHISSVWAFGMEIAIEVMSVALTLANRLKRNSKHICSAVAHMLFIKLLGE